MYTSNAWELHFDLLNGGRQPNYEEGIIINDTLARTNEGI